MVFSLVIDQVTPKISMDPATSETTDPLLTISGTVDKKNISTVSVSKNSLSAIVSTLSNGRFSADIKLERGKNLVTVTAVDLAGNSSTVVSSVYLSTPPDTVFFKFDDKTVSDGDFVSPTASIKITDDAGVGIAGGAVKMNGTDAAYDEATGAVTAGTLSAGTHTIMLTSGSKTYSLSFAAEDTLKINSAVSCPNPFDPASQSTTITCNVSKDSEISAYIFDLKGSLVWKDTAAARTGLNSDLVWNGKTLDGRNLSNGVYILRLLAKDPTGSVSTCSGKIIIIK